MTHHYNGRCPDPLQPDARDPACPACYPAATGVPCPTCGAAVGMQCVLMRGGMAGCASTLRPHDARRRAASAARQTDVDVLAEPHSR